jgi:protein-tyrosine phosphatase
VPAGPPPRGSSAPTAPSWIALDGAVNVRDLGGRPVRGGGRVRPGLVLRSDSLQGLSPRDVALLVDDLGVRTVLDLRTDWERRSEGPGPLSRHPVTHHALSLVPEAEAGDRVLPNRDGTSPLEIYLGYLSDAPTQIARSFDVFADDASGVTVFHCAAGKDRTGVLAALLLTSLGVDREEVMADYLASNEVVPAILDRLLASPTYRQQLAGAPVGALALKAAVMEGVLDTVEERHGGVEGWLQEAGVTQSTLAALRRRLVLPAG